MQWGYTGARTVSQVARTQAYRSDTAIMESNAGGLLAKEFDSHAVKAIWDFEGIYASSRHVPGVRFAGTIALHLLPLKSERSRRVQA